MTLDTCHADNLMKLGNQVVNTANKFMEQLTHSMEDIFKASEETSKIIIHVRSLWTQE
jgi:hypothetical protein